MSAQRENAAFDALRASMTSYFAISDATWQQLRPVCRYRELDKNALLYGVGVVPSSFAFVYRGLFRVFISDAKGGEYNKNFFSEGMFPGAMTALLLGQPSAFSIVALEPSAIIEIDFAAYRRLLNSCDDLKWYHIHYLEKNWLLLKEAREVELVQQDASVRYARFCAQHPDWLARLPQHHIASHLGITPTQLSRIRKKMAASQPM